MIEPIPGGLEFRVSEDSALLDGMYSLSLANVVTIWQSTDDCDRDYIEDDFSSLELFKLSMFTGGLNAQKRGNTHRHICCDLNLVWLF